MLSRQTTVCILWLAAVVRN